MFSVSTNKKRIFSWNLLFILITFIIIVLNIYFIIHLYGYLYNKSYKSSFSDTKNEKNNEKNAEGDITPFLAIPYESENGKVYYILYPTPALGNYKIAIVEFINQDYHDTYIVYCKDDVNEPWVFVSPLNNEEYIKCIMPCENIIKIIPFLEFLNNYTEKDYRLFNDAFLQRFPEGKPKYFSFHYIPFFYKRELERYNLSPYLLNISLTIIGPIKTSMFPPSRSRYDSGDKIINYFNNLTKFYHLDHIYKDYDFLVFAYIYDYSSHLYDEECIKKLENYSSKNFENSKEFVSFAHISAVYANLNNLNIADNIDTVLHELTHLFGASDLYISPCDRHKGWTCCKLPEGIPEPYKNPLFPQSKSCLMCGTIEISENESGIGASLIDEVICNATAKKIGWLSGEKNITTYLNSLF